MWLDLLSESQREVLIRLAHNVVVSDGLLDPNEERMLDGFRKEMELRSDVSSEYIEVSGMEDVFATQRSRAIVVLNLLHLSYSDGAFEIEEECLLRQLARQFDLSDDLFLLMDNWVRRLVALEAEARQFT